MRSFWMAAVTCTCLVFLGSLEAVSSRHSVAGRCRGIKSKYCTAVLGSSWEPSTRRFGVKLENERYFNIQSKYVFENIYVLSMFTFLLFKRVGERRSRNNSWCCVTFATVMALRLSGPGSADSQCGKEGWSLVTWEWKLAGLTRDKRNSRT